MQIMAVMESARADRNRRVMLWGWGLIAAFNLLDCLYDASTYKVVKAVGFLLMVYGTYRNGTHGPSLASAQGHSYSLGAFALLLVGGCLAAGAFIVHELT